MSDVIGTWLKGSTSFITEVTTFVGALTAFLTALVKARRQLARRRRISATLREVFDRRNPWCVVGVTLLAVAVTIGVARFAGAEHLPLNAQLAKAAWEAVNHRNWSRALVAASDCVDTFGGQAEDEQRQLEQAKIAE